MILVKPSVDILRITEAPLKMIEFSARTCYKSEDKITEDSSKAFVQKLLVRGHEAMLEFAGATVKFVCDRGVSHELVRHRLFSFAQESTRYCNYKGGVTFVIPPWISTSFQLFDEVVDYDAYLDWWRSWHTHQDTIRYPEGFPDDVDRWIQHMISSEREYKGLLEHKWTPQQARSVLPNSLKTEIVVRGNFREWRHFFKLRTDMSAHPQMREVACPLLEKMQAKVPVIFDEFTGCCKD